MPPPSRRELERDAAVRGFFRGLGFVLGPVVLFCGIPIGSCELACVPYETLCDEAGGSYWEPAHLPVCDVPAPIDATHRCPAGFGPGTRDGTCLGGILSPRACVFPWQRP